MHEITRAAPLPGYAAPDPAPMANVSHSDNFVNSNTRTVHVPAHDVAAIVPFVRQRVEGPRPQCTSIRTTREQRDSTFALDIACGMIGELSLHQLLFGPIGLHFYLQQREVMSQYPVAIGDGGSDIAGLNLDLKSSIWRNKNLMPEQHNLILPLRFFDSPRHASRIYALALCDELQDGSWNVHHVGWTQGYHIERTESFRFTGCAAVPGTDLCPWPPLCWQFGGAA